MEKCSICQKDFPEAAMKKMIQIVERKAYDKSICPSCQAIVSNNPNYYYLVEEKK
ncbi:MAG: hypothetical protein PHX14_11380 [Syntrophomonadaceae bacterium]|nr:hypothetical protein [Syntrophomonadaceae bacterium]